jgi:hypothetical protein
VAEENVRMWRLVWLGPLTVIASLVSVLIVRIAAFALVELNGDYPPLTPTGLTFFTTALVSLAVVVFAMVIKISSTPIRTYRRIALVALVLSFIPDLFLPGQEGQPGATWSAAIVLMVMHVAAWMPVQTMLTNPRLVASRG